MREINISHRSPAIHTGRAVCVIVSIDQKTRLAVISILCDKHDPAHSLRCLSPITSHLRLPSRVLHANFDWQVAASRGCLIHGAARPSPIGKRSPISCHKPRQISGFPRSAGAWWRSPVARHSTANMNGYQSPVHMGQPTTPRPKVGRKPWERNLQ